jgi:hypothetical protein
MVVPTRAMDLNDVVVVVATYLAIWLAGTVEVTQVIVLIDLDYRLPTPSPCGHHRLRIKFGLVCELDDLWRCGVVIMCKLGPRTSVDLEVG